MIVYGKAVGVNKSNMVNLAQFLQGFNQGLIFNCPKVARVEFEVRLPPRYDPAAVDVGGKE